MIPSWAVGAAILVIIWMGLWWLVGGREEHSPLGCRAIAGAWGVLALHEAATYQSLLLSAMYLWLTVHWALLAQRRQQVEARLAAWVMPDGKSNPIDT